MSIAGVKQDLSYLMLGRQGGKNRIKILEMLKDRPYNLNQLANELELNYRTVKHHIDILLDYDLVTSSGEGYGKVYFLSPRLEKNYQMLEDIEIKLDTISKSPKLYEKVVKQTHEGIIILDEHKDIIFINKSAQEITGYEDKELLGRNIDVLIESDIQRSLEKVLISDEYVEKVMRLKTKSGEKRTISTTLDYFSYEDKEQKIYCILMRDITEKTKQKDILDALMKNSEVRVAYLNTAFDILYVNSAYAKMTDHTLGELIGKNHFKLFPDKKNEEIFKEVVEKGEKSSIMDRPLFSLDGSESEGTYWTLDPVKSSKGEVKGLILSQWKNHDLSSEEKDRDTEV